LFLLAVNSPLLLLLLLSLLLNDNPAARRFASNQRTDRCPL
jgi:hypothetical protein